MVVDLTLERCIRQRIHAPVFRVSAVSRRASLENLRRGCLPGGRESRSSQPSKSRPSLSEVPSVFGLLDCFLFRPSRGGSFDSLAFFLICPCS